MFINTFNINIFINENLTNHLKKYGINICINNMQYPFFPTQRKAFIILATQGTENNANSQAKPFMI